MIAIYKDNLCIDIITVEEYLNTPTITLRGKHAEYVTCSLID